jgi:hypothetical protein
MDCSSSAVEGKVDAIQKSGTTRVMIHAEFASESDVTVTVNPPEIQDLQY